MRRYDAELDVKLGQLERLALRYEQILMRELKRREQAQVKPLDPCIEEAVQEYEQASRAATLRELEQMRVERGAILRKLEQMRVDLKANPQVLEVLEAAEMVELTLDWEQARWTNRLRAAISQDFLRLLGGAKPTHNNQPPGFGQYLLWYLPRKDRDAVTGDLEEEFGIIYKCFGRRRAVIWYYFQVAASFWPYAIRAGEKLIKWGILGWVGDLVRRIIP